MKRRSSLALAGFLASAPWLGAAQAKVDFAKDIRPIFEQNCVMCHGPGKQEAKLRLDQREAALKGGKDGAVIVAGSADKSDLYRRINLPRTDGDFMPHEGQPLAKQQIDLIRDWINQGAVWAESAAKSAERAPAGPVLPENFKPTPAEAAAIAKFAQSGTDIRPIAANVPWTGANFRLQGASVTDAVIAPLRDVTSLTDLDLGTTKITDAGLAAIEGLVNLTRLHLELTAVTDRGLARLKNLKNLTYLNVYGTAVTDSGLDQLKGLRHLRNLYVWQTKVTEAGVKKLKAALPGLEVSTGWDLAAPAKTAEPPAQKKAEAPKK
jgi:mono/diheme cytochrome c family protein